MFIKIIVVLLLLIVAASLLAGRVTGDSRPSRRARPELRTLMVRVAIVLLAVGLAVVAWHSFA